MVGGISSWSLVILMHGEVGVLAISTTPLTVISLLLYQFYFDSHLTVIMKL